MKFLVALLTICCIAQSCADVSQNEKEKKYELVWSDEFDKDGPPDSTKWDYERGYVRNEEFQWYQPENAYCKNGILIIEAKKESNNSNNIKSIISNEK